MTRNATGFLFSVVFSFVGFLYCFLFICFSLSAAFVSSERKKKVQVVYGKGLRMRAALQYPAGQRWAKDGDRRTK